jgi:hypothetical protein
MEMKENLVPIKSLGYRMKDSHRGSWQIFIRPCL